MENHHFLMGKFTINGPFSIAMLVYQRKVYMSIRDQYSNTYVFFGSPPGDETCIVYWMCIGNSIPFFSVVMSGTHVYRNYMVLHFNCGHWVWLQPLCHYFPFLHASRGEMHFHRFGSSRCWVSSWVFGWEATNDMLEKQLATSPCLGWGWYAVWDISIHILCSMSKGCIWFLWQIDNQIDRQTNR